MAPPRGGDRDFLEPFLVTQARTDPLASSQPTQREPIDKRWNEWETEALPAPENLTGSDWFRHLELSHQTKSRDTLSKKSDEGKWA